VNGFFKDKRVLVTGHKGFIGSKIAQRVSDEGGVVIGLDRCRCDVGDYEQVARLFDHDRPQVVFHLAAQTEVGKSINRPYETYRTNVVGTLNVLECCRRWPVESAVFASSDKAYGDGPVPYRETQPLQPNADPYSMSKRMADELCQHYGRTFDLPVRVLRCANVYGPGQTNQTTLVTRTILNLLDGKPPVLHEGRSDVDREWLYVDDAVEAYLLAASCWYPEPQVWNVGSREVASASDVVGMIAYALDSTRLVNNDSIVRERGPRVSIGDQQLDSSLFRRCFPAWTTTPLDGGLRRTIAWHREQKQ
jgi:nucleoside-diphosphate-sugar epimerase